MSKFAMETKYQPIINPDKVIKTTIMRILISLMALLPTVAYATSPLNLPNDEVATVGLYIADIRNGSQRTIKAHNQRAALTPASILKSVTTATALHLLGPDFTFETTVSLGGDGTISDSTLMADIYITGSGDPTLGSSHFSDQPWLPSLIANALEERGVKSVSGGVYAWPDTMPQQGVVDQWEVEDIVSSYGVGLFQLNFMDNCLGDEVNEDPAGLLVAETYMSLAEKGIEAGDHDINDGFFTPDSLPTPLLVNHSPKLKEIMKSLMVRSDNLMAEGVLRAIVPGAMRDSVIAVEKRFWEGKGIDTEHQRILDGSGLARSNAVSARFVADVLTAMAHDRKVSRDYVSLFPRAGRDGTLKSFLRKTRLEGKLALKTGSMTGVQCYAGYKLDGNDNPTHVVVIMVNNFGCERVEVRKAAERLLLQLF